MFTLLEEFENEILNNEKNLIKKQEKFNWKKLYSIRKMKIII
jgi:hypothetical protein